MHLILSPMQFRKNELFIWNIYLNILMLEIFLNNKLSHKRKEFFNTVNSNRNILTLNNKLLNKINYLNYRNYDSINLFFLIIAKIKVWQCDPG